MNKYIGMLLILGLSSCSNPNKTATASRQAPNPGIAMEGVQLENPKIQAIYESYLALKNALVSSKYADSKIAANQLSIDLGDFQGCENTALIAKKISNSKNIAEQRKEFTYLSSDVIAMFKHTALKQGVIYVEHCPMANNGEGGDWLSGEKKIQNPYYGSAMLECGSVIQELKKGS
jgi:hypothetical protein